MEVKSIEELFDIELEKKTAQTVKYIQSLLPKGKLRDSIRYIRNGSCDYSIVTDVPYASFVEFGTGIYGSTKKPITPKNKQALRFEIDDNIIFAKSVRGQQGQFFFRAGKEYMKGLFETQSTGIAKRYFNKSKGLTRRLLKRLK